MTFNGLAYTIGILGSIASIMTVFVSNWNSSVNVKWFLFLFFISSSIFLILMKLVYDFNDDFKKKHYIKLNFFVIYLII